MYVYLVAWPNNTYSVYATSIKPDWKKLLEFGNTIDMAGDPGSATIFQIRMESGEFFCCLPEHQNYEDPPKLPLTHIGRLEVVQLKPPFGKLLSDRDQEQL